MSYESTKVAVIGAGMMGCGIAQVFATQSISTVLFNPIPRARAAALDRIRANLTRVGIDYSCLDYINISDSLADALDGVNVVIEAAPEKLALKQALFAELVAGTPSSCTLASNTSVIPIRDIAAGLDTAERIIGTHWWNPPYLVPLVEVVQAKRSAPEHVAAMIDLLNYVGKKPIHVKKDVTGFVANRMQHALWREAIALVNDGVCDAQTVDIAVKNSFGLRLPVLGPIENADLVGLELTQDIHNVVLADLNADQQSAPILAEKLANGELGMKSGHGLRQWTEEQAEQVRQNLNDYLLYVTEQPFKHSDN